MAKGLLMGGAWYPWWQRYQVGLAVGIAALVVVDSLAVRGEMRWFVTEVAPLLGVILAALALGYVGVVARAIRADIAAAHEDVVMRLAELEARYDATLRPHIEEPGA